MSQDTVTAAGADEPESNGPLQVNELPAAYSRMDPRLQRAGLLAAAGPRRRSSASTAGDEIAVIALVSDLAAWTELSEVRPGVQLGATDAQGRTLVTARIPSRRVQQVRQQPFVVSLKAAQRVRPQLSATTAETLSRPVDMPAGSGVARGAGVLVGVVDFGGDFVHRNFRRASGGGTRLLALWDQSQPGPGGASPGLPGYGVVHVPGAINAALKRPDPYAALGYAVEDEAHGTHVMDIAAGNGRGTGVPGMAPAADLVFVELSASDVAWQGQGAVGNSFGDSVQLLEALQFIYAQAGSRPCVINMSLGTNGGPHDGSTLVEQGIDRLVRAGAGRAVVIAAGNSQADGIHAQGQVPAGGTLDLKVQTARAAFATEDELELWYSGASRLSAELIAPDGRSLGKVQPGQTVSITTAGGALLGMLANRLRDPNNGDNVINVWWSARLPKGAWTLRLASGTGAVPWHAWIERNDQAQTSFLSHRTDTHTLGSVSCGAESIVVASYDAHKVTRPISFFSSSGPTRDGRNKPEVAAPGHAVVAARSTSVNGSTVMSGTSMAAPAVAGLVALVLAAARKRGLSLDSAAIRRAVTATARPSTPGTAWDPRFGTGRISGKAAVAAVMALARPPVAKAARKPHVRKQMARSRG